MSRTAKNRREAYDNIAVASAITTQERVITGATGPAVERVYGNTENIAVASDYGQENDPVAVDRLTGERVGGA